MSFEVLLSHMEQMLTKTKTKMLNFGKQREKWSGEPNLALICLTGTEKTGFTDGRTTDGRTTDARVTTVALQCSSTKQS